MYAEDGAFAGHQVHVGVRLVLVHLCEGREELLEMLGRCCVAVRRLGPVYESHLEADGTHNFFVCEKGLLVICGGPLSSLLPKRGKSSPHFNPHEHNAVDKQIKASLSFSHLGNGA